MARLKSSRWDTWAAAESSAFKLQALARPIITKPRVEMARLIFTVSGLIKAIRSTNVKHSSSGPVVDLEVFHQDG